MERKRVLFVCTHNSARSQMAEALLRHLYGDRFDAASAGTESTRLHPLSVAVMAELGIDISGQRSKTLDDVADQRFDIAITVCDEAREACPIIPGAFETLHWSLPDPSQAEGSEEGRLAVFRSARDEIKRRLEETYA